MTGSVVDYTRLGSGDTVLSDMSESYATVAAESERFFFLLRRAGKVFLAVGSFDQGLVTTYELSSAERYAGPIKVGKGVAAYSREKLYLLEEEKVHEIPFRNGFLAWDAPGHAGDLRPPAGHLPYLATADALYIPGVSNSTPTLLRVTQEAFVPLVSEEGVYLCDGQGRLLFSAQGEIRMYEGGVPVPIQNDGQLQGRQGAFVDGPLAVGFVKLGGGGEALRFYQKGKRQDCPASRLGRGVNAMGFYFLGDSLALAYLTDLSLRVAVWDI